jgi:hypothetical protein
LSTAKPIDVEVGKPDFYEYAGFSRLQRRYATATVNPLGTMVEVLALQLKMKGCTKTCGCFYTLLAVQSESACPNGLFLKPRNKSTLAQSIGQLRLVLFAKPDRKWTNASRHQNSEHRHI